MNTFATPSRNKWVCKKMQNIERLRFAITEYYGYMSTPGDYKATGRCIEDEIEHEEIAEESQGGILF